MRLPRPLLVLVPIALLAAACGDDDADTASAGNRTIDVRMADNDFDPAGVEVGQGETVTFVFENTGAVEHDAFIGDAAAQAEHEAEMNGSGGGADMGEGEGDGDGGDMADTTATTETGEMGDHAATDDDAISVAPGETGELTYTFDRPGVVEVGCHEPGHYDAGMKIRVTVT